MSVGRSIRLVRRDPAVSGHTPIGLNLRVPSGSSDTIVRSSHPSTVSTLPFPPVEGQLGYIELTAYNETVSGTTTKRWIVSSEDLKSVADWAEVANTDKIPDNKIPTTVTNRLIPAGGTADQYLRKVDGTDYNVEWAGAPVESWARPGNTSTIPDNKIPSGIARDSELPAANELIPDGGSTNQVLSKTSGNNQAVNWRTVSEVPTGGTTGQVLSKSSNTNNDTGWETLIKVPTGGMGGQVLTKASDTSGDVDWQSAPSLPIGGTTGQVLAKRSNTNGDATWVDQSGGY